MELQKCLVNNNNNATGSPYRFSTSNQDGATGPRLNSQGLGRWEIWIVLEGRNCSQLQVFVSDAPEPCRVSVYGHVIQRPKDRSVEG